MKTYAIAWITDCPLETPDKDMFQQLVQVRAFNKKDAIRRTFPDIFEDYSWDSINRLSLKQVIEMAEDGETEIAIIEIKQERK